MITDIISREIDYVVSSNKSDEEVIKINLIVDFFLENGIKKRRCDSLYFAENVITGGYVLIPDQTSNWYFSELSSTLRANPPSEGDITKELVYLHGEVNELLHDISLISIKNFKLKLIGPDIYAPNHGMYSITFDIFDPTSNSEPILLQKVKCLYYEKDNNLFFSGEAMKDFEDVIDELPIDMSTFIYSITRSVLAEIHAKFRNDKEE